MGWQGAVTVDYCGFTCGDHELCGCMYVVVQHVITTHTMLTIAGTIYTVYVPPLPNLSWSLPAAAVCPETAPAVQEDDQSICVSRSAISNDCQPFVDSDMTYYEME